MARLRWASWFQNATSAITALVFLGLIALAFVVPHAAAVPEPLRQQPASSLPFFVACVLVLQAVIYTYDGWYSIIYFGEEIHNPGRDVPRSMIGGVLLLTGIYVLINVALLYVLPVSSIAGQNLAVGALTRVLFGGYGDLLLRAVMIVSLVSLVNVNLLCLPRVLFAMSRDGWSSASVGRVNKGGTPSVALFLSLGACLLLILSGSFDRIIALAAFFNVAKYTMAYVAVFKLRRKEPEAALPYRAWGHPWTTGAAGCGIIGLCRRSSLGRYAKQSLCRDRTSIDVSAVSLAGQSPRPGTGLERNRKAFTMESPPSGPSSELICRFRLAATSAAGIQGRAAIRRVQMTTSASFRGTLGGIGRAARPKP
jgi:amino acid transporter